MTSPYRESSSYYKDSYESSSMPAKRFHSVSGPSSHYYHGMNVGDDRKRHRLDNTGSSQTSSRYNSSTDYQHRTSSSSSFMGGKTSASYYEGTSHHHRTSSSSSGHKPSSSLQPLFRQNESSTSYDHHRTMSSSSKYLDTAPSTSRRYEDVRSSKFSPPRRVPPPLGHSSSMSGGYPSRSKSSASNGNLLPLMKLSVDSSNKYSRYRQAPPEHHREGAHYSSYAAPSHSLHPRSDLSRRSIPTSSPITRSRYPTTSSFRGSYVKPSLASIRKATQLTAASVTSRIRKRAASARMSRDRERDPKRYHKDRPFSSTRRADKSREKSTDSKDHEEDVNKIKVEGKSKSDEEGSEHAGEEGREEGDAEMETEENKSIEDKDDQSKSGMDKDDESGDKDNAGADDESSAANENETEEGKQGDDTTATSTGEKKRRDKTASDKDKKDDGRSGRGRSHHSDQEGSTKRSRHGSEGGGGEKDEVGHTKALLKLHCHYCKIRCISFREFTAHLRSYGHAKSMNNAVSEMRKTLNILRSDQRDQQRKLEKSKSDKTLSDTTSYCRVCELNFRTDPTEHEKNELHNQIKTLIYQRCDVCDIDFRIWKVYLYHMAALEHAKRVAMKELQERESSGETVKGTNLSPEELGFNLVEQRTVLYCNACVRYIPIKDSEEEAKTRHCMTFSHIKYVDEFNERERKYKEKKAREEERKLAAAAAEDAKVEDEKINVKSEEDDKNADADMTDSANTNNDSVDGEGERNEQQESTNIEDEAIPQSESMPRIKVEANVTEGANVSDHEDEKEEEEEETKDEDEDQDEIVLHAEDMDDDGEEDESEEARTWSRRATRSSTRKSKGDSTMN